MKVNPVIAMNSFLSHQQPQQQPSQNSSWMWSDKEQSAFEDIFSEIMAQAEESQND